MSTQLEERIDDLEAKMAFQDDTIQALNDMVGKQQLELDTLRRAVELLAARQADLAASLPVEAADDEPPPHY